MIVIVAGMHRSGTSALAGMLHHNGIVMGEDIDFYPPPMKENPKGFFENVRFRRANDQMLAEYGYRVKSFNPIVPAVKSTRSHIRAIMKQLVDEYDKRYTVWGWKDPRTCLTLAVWMDIIRQKDVKILIPCRAPRDVARSMIARGNKGTVNQLEALANAYNNRLIKAVNDFDFMTIDFNDFLCKTKEAAEQISLFLDHQITKTDFIEPEISKQRI